MARKQKSKGFNKFLDLIGLVNEEGDMDGDFEADYDVGRGRSRSAGRTVGDEFSDEPRMSRAQPRRERAQTNASDRFDADEGWNTAASSRPQYGARTQQRTQSAARTSNRYGSEQRYGGASNTHASSRYDAGSTGASSRYDAGSTRDAGYSRSASAYGGRRANTQRGTEEGYDMYGSSYYGGYEEESYGYGSGAKQEMPAQSGGFHRHQTVIFKLRSVEECKDVIKALIEKKSVLLNLDELDTLQTQRTIDTMCGATYAIGATLSRASDRTWLITPSTVDVADSQPDMGAGYGSRYI